MRILLSYASEFDKGEGIHYARVLRSMGHEVAIVNVAGTGDRTVQGYAADVHVSELVRIHGRADLFLFIDPPGLIPLGLEQFDGITACVLCDTHRDLKSRQTQSKLFDHVFLYQRNYLEAFSGRRPDTVHWLPYACDTDYFRDLGRKREIDIGFVGQLFGPNSDRRRILSALAKRYRINELRSYQQEEIPECYSRSKIVLNLPVADDLNFRFFEALSCGALLLTRRIKNGQEELFREGVHYAAFGDEHELYSKVEHYLTHDDERARVASAGHSEILEKHSLRHRLEFLLSKCSQGSRDGAPARKLDRKKVLGLYLQILERSGRIEAMLRIAANNSGSRFRACHLAAKAFMRRLLIRW